MFWRHREHYAHGEAIDPVTGLADVSWFAPSGEPMTSREYSDARYAAKCRNPACRRKDLMPFMRYCPWCRTKVRRAWKIPE